MLWSGEWLEGTGKSTGEETEQIISFQSRCGNTTKYQTPESMSNYLNFIVQSSTNNQIFHELFGSLNLNEVPGKKTLVKLSFY